MARSLRALRRAVRCAGVMLVGRTGRAVESRRAVTRSNCGPTLDDAVAVVVTVRRSNMLEPCVRLGRARREAHDDNMAVDWAVVQEKKRCTNTTRLFIGGPTSPETVEYRD